MSPSAVLATYRAGSLALAPFARWLLLLRARRGKEMRARLEERLGHTTLARPPGPLLWLHGASIGESLSLLPLIDAVRGQGFATLLTTGTPAGAVVAGARLPPGALHQFAPLDTPPAVRAFLDHWRPQMLLLAESELWPNTICACARRKIPVAVVNGRLSERSRARWSRAPQAAAALFGQVALCTAQSAEQGARFTTFGARRVIVAGNLKYDVPLPPADPHELARLRAMAGARPVLVAASTHPGEEEIVLAAHRAASAVAPDLLTILVPRDVSRGGAIAAMAGHAGLATRQRSLDRAASLNTAVLVADTVGEMGLWLRLASLVVIGKTLGDTVGAGGGQTPLEAAGCGAPVLHGPATSSFAEVFAALDAGGGALPVTAQTLGETVVALLRDPARARDMARQASRVVGEMAGATARTLDALEPFLKAARNVQG